VFTLSNW
jgi:NhaP-type Na+/H+ or K+/H+ antiporter